MPFFRSVARYDIAGYDDTVYGSTEMCSEQGNVGQTEPAYLWTTVLSCIYLLSTIIKLFPLPPILWDVCALHSTLHVALFIACWHCPCIKMIDIQWTYATPPGFSRVANLKLWIPTMKCSLDAWSYNAAQQATCEIMTPTVHNCHPDIEHSAYADWKDTYQRYLSRHRPHEPSNFLYHHHQLLGQTLALIVNKAIKQTLW